MDRLWHDIRYALRQLRRAPGFTLVAVLVIALGIGANIAMFTVVRSVLLKPLPFKDPNRLLMLYEHGPSGGKEFSYNAVAGGIFAQWNKLNSTFSSMAAVQEDQADLSASGGQLPETLNTANVSWNLFSTLGVQPALGRTFVTAEDSPAANGTAVLSWSLWKPRFSSDPAILSHSIQRCSPPSRGRFLPLPRWPVLFRLGGLRALIPCRRCARNDMHGRSHLQHGVAQRS